MTNEIRNIEHAMAILEPMPPQLAKSEPDVAATLESALLCLDGARRGLICARESGITNLS